MEKRGLEIKVATDYEPIGNPVDNLDTESPNPDKWVKPEMLRRIGEKSITEREKNDAVE